MKRRPDGVVLAGGLGRRLGRPKATVPLAGRSLVERAVEALIDRCASTVVVARAEVPLPALPCPVRLDRPGPPAPLVGVATGLAAVRAPDCLVLACDLPLAGPLLDELVAAPEGVAVVARDGDRPQPLCARYPRQRTLEEAERLIAAGELAMGGLLGVLEPVYLDANPPMLLNVNTPDDLAAAERHVPEA